MSDATNKRARRTPEERTAVIDAKIEVVNQGIEDLEAKKQASIASFDAKIATARDRIKALEQKKQEVLKPKSPRKTKKQKIQEIVKEAEKSGMKLEEIAGRLGINLD